MQVFVCAQYFLGTWQMQINELKSKGSLFDNPLQRKT